MADKENLEKEKKESKQEEKEQNEQNKENCSNEKELLKAKQQELDELADRHKRILA